MRKYVLPGVLGQRIRCVSVKSVSGGIGMGVIVRQLVRIRDEHRAEDMPDYEQRND